MAAPTDDPAVVTDDDAHSLDGYYSDTPVDVNPNYPALKKNFDTSIIISNLPKVPEAKIEKLTKVIIKVLARIGTLASCEETGYNGVHIPFNEDTKLTNGFAFVEYETSEDAEKAAEVLKDYKFDKNHILLVTPYERLWH